MSLTYLSSPYTSATIPAAIQWQYACRAASFLIDTGRVVFSPIAHSWGIDIAKKRPHGEWMGQDLEILRLCGELVELHTPGWENSKGMAQERRLALDLGIPILEMYPDGDGFVVGCNKSVGMEGFAV